MGIMNYNYCAFSHSPSYRAIMKAPSTDGGSKAMVHATYATSAQNEQSVIAEVDRIQVLINLPFMLKLVDFFVVALEPLALSVENKEMGKTHDEPAISEKDIPTTKKLPPMKLSLHVAQSNIALVEKQGTHDPKILFLEVLSFPTCTFQCFSVSPYLHGCMCG